MQELVQIGGARAEAPRKVAPRSSAEEIVVTMPTPQTFSKQARIVLYNPDAQLSARGVQTEELSQYLTKLIAVVSDSLQAVARPEDLDVVVAIRPGRRSRAWFVTSRPSDDSDLKRLKEALEGVMAPDITSESIVCALTGAIGGGTRQYRQFQLPVPDEWKHACADTEDSLSVDQIIDRVWPADEPHGWRRWLLWSR